MSQPKPEEPVQAAEIFNEPAQPLIEVALPAPADDAPLHLRQYDVVQVYDRESNNYGIIFQVGDVRGSKVHGYYFQPKADKVFVTFDMKQLRLIGSSRVRAKTCCSPKWVAEHNMPQQ